MCLMEEEKYRKQREDKHQKMKEELMLLKLEAENLKYENRVKAVKENEKYTEEELTEKFHMKCKQAKEKEEEEKLKEHKLQFEKQVEADFEAKMHFEIEKRKKEIEQSKRNKPIEFTKDEEWEIKDHIEKRVQARLEKEYGDNYLSSSAALKREPSSSQQESRENLNTLSNVMKRKHQIKTEKYNTEELAYPVHEVKTDIGKSECTPLKQQKVTSYDEFESYLTPSRGHGRGRVAGRGRGDHTALSPGPSVQRTLTFPSEMIPNVKVGSDEYMRQQSLNIQQKMEDADNLLLTKLPKKFASTIWQVLQVSNLTVNKSDISNIALIPTDSFY